MSAAFKDRHLVGAGAAACAVCCAAPLVGLLGLAGAAAAAVTLAVAGIACVVLVAGAALIVTLTRRLHERAHPWSAAEHGPVAVSFGRHE